jgi:isopropylmalate/homocitrate/citramalate synthase
MTKILECTLRDGSYAVDFQFTPEFSGAVIKKLNFFGFEYIEIGHGIGISASSKIKKAAGTDSEYADAANKSIGNSKWGMFAVHGIAEESDINKMIDAGMNFLRYGCTYSQINEALKFLMNFTGKCEIFLNCMRSHEIESKQISSICRDIDNIGISAFYLVDSCGGMLPDQVKKLGEKFLENKKNFSLGFHGHNNLGLANANSLMLSEMGFDFVDSTLQGLGRSTGNAMTEQLVSILTRMNKIKKHPLIELLKYGESELGIHVPPGGTKGIDTMAGYALFHTSMLDELTQKSLILNMDPFLLLQGHD